MAWRPIEKPKGGWTVVPNLLDYEKSCAGFSWERVQAELSGLPAGRGLNLAHEAVDRHAAGARRNHLALRFRGQQQSGRRSLRWREEGRRISASMHLSWKARDPAEPSRSLTS